MTRLFNNNLAFDYHKDKEYKNYLFQIFLLYKYQMFFEFDPDIKTFKIIPKIQKKQNYFRIMLWLFNFGIVWR